MDWLPSVLLAVGSAKQGSQLLAVWVFADVSRTLFAWHDPLPLKLGISFLASVVLAGHRKDPYLSYPYVDLPLELKISSLASVNCANQTLEESLSFLSISGVWKSQNFLLVHGQVNYKNPLDRH